jgi:uncharacterized membrane protein
MKKPLLLMAGLIVMASLVGCNKSATGGGAGDQTFKLMIPSSTTTVKQGEAQTVKVSLERGAGFKQGVKLDLKVPTGLTVEPDGTTVKAGDKGEVQLTIRAAKDAALGDQKIMVKGTPDQGEAVEMELKVAVIAP